MKKRVLLTIFAALLLLCIPAQADLKAWDKERINAMWAPHTGSESTLISELEFTMRFEPPSSGSGYLETELYLSQDCSGCDTNVVLEPGMWLREVGWPEWENAYIFLVVIEGPNPWPWLDSWLVFHEDVGWWRRHHQFRWWIKKDNNGDTFQYKVWDCDTQELLFSDTVHLEDTDYAGRITLVNATAEWSGLYMDYYHVWEGHWVKEAYPSGNAYRWDRAPWLIDGEIEEEHDEADKLEAGPVLHLYDDHPEACTGGIYWPTALSCEDSDDEPLFKSEVVDADDFRSHALSSAEVQEILQRAQGDKPREYDEPLGPEGPPEPPREYPEYAFLAHVFNGLEGNAHWNRVDMWHDDYY